MTQKVDQPHETWISLVENSKLNTNQLCIFHKFENHAPKEREQKARNISQLQTGRENALQTAEKVSALTVWKSETFTNIPIPRSRERRLTSKNKE